MDSRTVYAKTSKGVAEVAARSGALAMSARRVLIMIDGKRTVAELAPLLRPGEIEAAIEQLEAQGFVQRLQGAEAPAEVAAPVANNAQEPEERIALTLDEAKRRAVRALIDRLGPDGETMSIRIEQCRSNDELRDRLREAERLVAGMSGEAAAQAFLRALRGR